MSLTSFLKTLAALAVVFGGVALYAGFGYQRGLDVVVSEGIETDATITKAEIRERRDRGRRPHIVRERFVTLAWEDERGMSRSHERLVSMQTFNRITANETGLAETSLRIRYLPGRPDHAPKLQDEFADEANIPAITGGLSLAFGLGLACFVFWPRRKPVSYDPA